MRRRKNDQRRHLRRSFRSIENLDGKGSSCTGWCFQTSNYMYRAPRSTLKIAHWTISFTRYRFGHGALRPRVRTTVPSSPIESSRTMVLVTKATRCHRPWISVVVEICWGSGWWKGWTRDGRTGEEKSSLSLSLSPLAYIRFVYRCCSSKHMVRRRGGPLLQVSASRFISHPIRWPIANLPPPLPISSIRRSPITIVNHPLLSPAGAAYVTRDDPS